MTLEEYLKTDRTKNEIMELLCDIANRNFLSVDELWCYKELSENFNITMDDFIDDLDELSEYKRCVIGYFNWKVKL